MDLSIRPNGRLYLKESIGQETEAVEEVKKTSASNTSISLNQSSLLQQSIALSESKFLLQLLDMPWIKSKSASFSFWLQFSSDFLHKICELADEHTDVSSIEEKIIFPTDSYFSQLISSLPPMEGGSNLSEDLLKDKWSGLIDFVASQCADLTSDQKKVLSLREYLKDQFPKWGMVAKLHFHLAENTENPDRPFAFLATYAFKDPERERVQHLPLGSAIKNKGAMRDFGGLESLLNPLRQAAKSCPFLQKQIESKKIFQACEFSVMEAFSFLNSIEFYQQAGIVAKVPKIWNESRPPKAKVTVSVSKDEESKKGKLGLAGLMKFSTSVTIDGKPLTAEELNKILEEEGPLVSFGGKWIEVDKAQIEPILDRLKKAESIAGDQISFSEAMKMLSGSPQTSDDGDLNFDEQQRKWIDFVADKKLAKMLEQLRRPATLDHSGAQASTLDQYLQATLRPYQKDGVHWLYFLRGLGLGGCLADDMGLGKTIQVISFLILYKYELQKKSDGCPNLIVAPASLIANWVNEIKKFAPSLKVFVAHSSGPTSTVKLKKTPDGLASYDVVITTYGTVGRVPWASERRWQNLIIDEAQAIKNAQTKTSKFLKEIQAQCKYALTGTPVENRMQELWSIFDFCSPGLLGSSKQFNDFLKGTLNSDDKNAFSPLRKLIDPYILRRKKTDKSIISDLPDKVEMKAYCYLSPLQIKLYQKQMRELMAALKEMDKSDKRRRTVILTSLQKFKQICNHPSQVVGDQKYDPDDSGKFFRLRELLEPVFERGEKVLIFTQFRELTDILDGFLSQIAGRAGLVLHGGIAVSKRQKLVEEFQDPQGPSHFILSLRAAGTGLNLTAANHVIHFDRWWNPAVEDQATDRAYRIGQKQNVMVHKFVTTGTIEERIDEMIAEKKDIADQILEGETTGRDQKLTEMSDEELIDLVSLDISKV